MLHHGLSCASRARRGVFELCFCVSGRLELPDGLGVPVSQLARLRLGVRLPLRGRHRRPQRHAGESPLLPGGLELLPSLNHLIIL